mmetsp:Transcript_184/g.193  ORF Transcript_184/g.193 Transcript_184/m.193 type:complete len:281 (-) Transcript_184:412-1254(-)
MSEPVTKKSKTSSSPMKLRKLGFCGADDSVSPRMLGLICQSYPFVEFGVLFRPGQEGQPRYASQKWISELAKVVKLSHQKMQLAAHLCGQRVNDILQNNDESQKFLSKLPSLGFYRVQINATAVNGVDTSNLSNCVDAIAKAILSHPELEFILQKNEETKPLWEGLLGLTSFGNGKGKLPKNVVMLVDESKGTGVLASSWPSPPKEYDIGYAGGIGPDNVKDVLNDIMNVAHGREVWIDMESSLRSAGENKSDVFDLGKCFKCIEVVCDIGLYDHPPFLY